MKRHTNAELGHTSVENPWSLLLGRGVRKQAVVKVVKNIQEGNVEGEPNGVVGRCGQ
jgi:hypothetical protein